MFYSNYWPKLNVLVCVFEGTELFVYGMLYTGNHLNIAGLTDDGLLPYGKYHEFQDGGPRFIYFFEGSKYHYFNGTLKDK